MTKYIARVLIWLFIAGNSLSIKLALADTDRGFCKNAAGDYSYFLTDPDYTESTEDGLTILHKELFGYGYHGLADGAVDILYSGQANTWTFTLPSPIQTGKVRIVLVLDDNERPGSDYMGKISVNGKTVFDGRFLTRDVHHGVPYGGTPFTNWTVVSFPLKLSQPSSSINIAIENNTCDNEGGFVGDWIAIDYIELGFRHYRSSLPQQSRRRGYRE